MPPFPSTHLGGGILSVYIGVLLGNPPYFCVGSLRAAFLFAPAITKPKWVEGKGVTPRFVCALLYYSHNPPLPCHLFLRRFPTFPTSEQKTLSKRCVGTVVTSPPPHPRSKNRWPTYFEPPPTPPPPSASGSSSCCAETTSIFSDGPMLFAQGRAHLVGGARCARRATKQRHRILVHLAAERA